MNIIQQYEDIAAVRCSNIDESLRIAVRLDNVNETLTKARNAAEGSVWRDLREVIAVNVVTAIYADKSLSSAKRCEYASTAWHLHYTDAINRGIGNGFSEAAVKRWRNMCATIKDFLSLDVEGEFLVKDATGAFLNGAKNAFERRRTQLKEAKDKAELDARIAEMGGKFGVVADSGEIKQQPAANQPEASASDDRLTLDLSECNPVIAESLVELLADILDTQDFKTDKVDAAEFIVGRIKDARTKINNQFRVTFKAAFTVFKNQATKAA